MKGEARPPSRRSGTAALAPRARSSERRGWLALILTVHAALAVWGASRNSVTFDENFHLPSGFVVVSRGDFRVSEVNPPLVKALCALPALVCGALPPDRETVLIGEQSRVGESFMRRNRDRYHALFLAGRSVVVLMSVLLGLLIWSYARRLYGPRAALLATAVYAFLPESLAHAGFVTLDLATGLGFLASAYAYWKFARTGWWSNWMMMAAAVGATSATRFTGWMLLPIFILLAVVGGALGWVRRPGRLALGIALLVPVIVVVLDVAYLGRVALDPISTVPFVSDAFQNLQHLWPWLRLPLPESYLAGLDHQLYENQGIAPAYLLGRIHSGVLWTYYPLALLFKWPLGFLGLLAGRAWVARPRGRRLRHELHLLLPALVILATAVFVGRLNVGVRYLFPMLPFLCVWLGGWLADAPAAAARVRPAVPRARTSLALVLAGVLMVETLTCAPWYLSFFNLPSGGPGGGDRLVNDSNVDWGQGLIALREEMKRRGIRRIDLAYHGTTDPSIYGIAYRPDTTGSPGPDAEWLAVSSYYFVGLAQKMMTPEGRTQPVRMDWSRLWEATPVARPARCMYLFRLETRPPESPSREGAR